MVKKKKLKKYYDRYGHNYVTKDDLINERIVDFKVVEESEIDTLQISVNCFMYKVTIDEVDILCNLITDYYTDYVYCVTGYKVEGELYYILEADSPIIKPEKQKEPIPLHSIKYDRKRGIHYEASIIPKRKR